MTVPPRHEPDGSRQGIAESIAESAASLERHLGGDKWASEWSPGLNRKAFNNAMQRAWLDPSDRAIAHDLELVACTAAVAHVAALTPGKDAFEAPAPGGRIVEATRNAGPPKQLAPPEQWRSGVLAAVITRNACALDMLTAIPAAELRRLAGPHAPSWFEVESRGLAALFRAEAGASELLRVAAETADSDRVDPLSKDWVLDIVVPEMHLGISAIEGDPLKFDRSLETALERHHHYYVDERRVQYHGLLALAPLAIACFASDRGLVPSIESDYVPRWLIQGRGARRERRALPARRRPKARGRTASAASEAARAQQRGTQIPAPLATNRMRLRWCARRGRERNTEWSLRATPCGNAFALPYANGGGAELGASELVPRTSSLRESRR